MTAFPGVRKCGRNQASLDGGYSLGSLYKGDNVVSDKAAYNIISFLFGRPTTVRL